MLRRFARARTWTFILAMLAVLAIGTTVEPRRVMAVPAPTGGPDGTPYGTGDPTGDDVPSPTPKPLSLTTYTSARTPGAVAVRGITTSVRWNLYLSILIRLGLR
jgi:hypothetical protein